MHFAVMVAVPADTTTEDLDDVVARILAPFNESLEHDCPRTEANDWDEECETCARSWCDWWQIGGRWTGFFDPSYQPEKDPANQETCIHCHGTGTRPDAAKFGEEWMKQTGGCNGCAGTGRAVKWPTQWAPSPANRATQTRALARLDQLVEMKRSKDDGWMFPHKVVAGEVVMTSDATDDFDAKTLELVAKGNGIDWVIVDCHV